MSKKELFRWSLNVAIVGAILYFVSGLYFGYAGQHMFRGAWALHPFVISPWYMMIGAMLAARRPADEKRTRISGIIAALLISAFTIWYSWPVGSMINYVQQELIAMPNYTLFPIACVMIGYWWKSYDRIGLISIGGAASIVFSFAVHLGCEYLLWGWTARNLDIPVWTNTIIRVLAVCSEVVVSLGILDYCRSEFAMRITGVKWLRVVLIVICAYIWLGYTFSANWRWPGYAICRSINPLTVGISYLIYRSACKLCKRLGGRNEE